MIRIIPKQVFRDKLILFTYQDVLIIYDFIECDVAIGIDIEFVLPGRCREVKFISRAT